MTPRPQEKRIFPRVQLRAPVYYQIRGLPDGENTLSYDISMGGIGLSDDSFIPTEKIVGLQISILSRVITPIGRVAWISGQPHSSSYRMGIQFVEFNALEKAYLSDYINFLRLT